MTTDNKFWDNTRPDWKTGCMEWTGAINQGGYGVVVFERNGRRTSTTAHRRAWELIHGSINRATVVRHSCDNPRCVNPNHLEVGSQADNMEDMRERGRENKSRSGRALGITPEQKRKAVSLGLSPADIAVLFDVGLRTAMRWRQIYSSTGQTG